MMDIDDLLCKPSHFVAFDSPVAFEEEETDENASKTHSGDFSSAKPLTELVAEEEQPWWTDSQQTKTDFSNAKKSSALEETPWWESKEKTEEVPAEPAEDKPQTSKDEDVEESEWESEYEEAEEEEEEGEWE